MSTQQRLNLYCEFNQAELNALRSARLAFWRGEYGSNPVRGAYQMGDYKYFVVNVGRINNGTKTSRNLANLRRKGDIRTAACK